MNNRKQHNYYKFKLINENSKLAKLSRIIHERNEAME